MWHLVSQSARLCVSVFAYVCVLWALELSFVLRCAVRSVMPLLAYGHLSNFISKGILNHPQRTRCNHVFCRWVPRVATSMPHTHTRARACKRARTHAFLHKLTAFIAALMHHLALSILHLFLKDLVSCAILRCAPAPANAHSVPK